MSAPLHPAHVRLPQAKLTRIDALRAAPRNARTHSKKQLRQISASIAAFGFTNPVLVDGSGEVIAGHGRLAAARMLGLHAQSAQIEAGHVHLPERASWLDDLRSEIAAFPQGRHDDQVDSISQFLAWRFEWRSRVAQQVRLEGV